MTVERVNAGEELSSCPRCGYEKGFHVAFRRSDRTLNLFLVCPSCAFRFTAGNASFPTGEPRPFDPTIDAGS